MNVKHAPNPYSLYGFGKSNPYSIYGSMGDSITTAPNMPTPTPPQSELPTVSPVWWALSTASMAACAYHGYKRNSSVGWALAWGALGAIFPVITPVIALAEGFGKPIRK